MVAPLSFSWHRIGYERYSCFRAVDVVLHCGRTAQPDRPDNFSVHLNGKPSTPRRHTRKRGDAGQKRRSLWINLKNSCVETPNRAVYALFWAISVVGIGAPSIRPKALRLPPSSRIATFSLTPSSLAFTTAASTIFCASS